MKVKKKFIAILVLAVDLCFAGIAIPTPEPIYKSELIDAVVHVLTSCYGELGPIGIAGSLPPTLLSKLWSKKPIPVILIDRSKRMHQESWIPRGKLGVFLLIAATSSEVVTGVRDLKKSRWYDRSAPTLVLCSASGPMTNECEVAVWVLMGVRVHATFNGNLMCLNSEKKITVYSVNPYTNRAPHPWQSVGYRIYNNLKHTSLFLFSRQYEASNDICINLDYDRTNDMGGGTINLHGGLPLSWSELVNRNMEHLDNQNAIELSSYLNIWEMVLRQLNATPRLGFMRRHAREKYPGPTVAGVILEPVAVRNLRPFHPIIQPVLIQRNRILTQTRGNKSQLRKILSVVDTYSRCCVGAVLFITLLFFKFLVHQQLIPGMLNVIRMMCNTGFTNVPDNVKSRTYLACLFLFVVTMHGIFAGNLASLLTNEVAVRHAQTIEDLVEFNYTVYATKSIFLLLSRTNYKGRLIRIIDITECSIVQRDPTAACISIASWLVEFSKLYNMHVSNHDVLESYQTFNIVFDVPYAHRASEIILRLFEADTIYPWQSRAKRIRKNEYEYFMRNQDPEPRIMNFNDLAFAFVILGIGLGCALISFVVEISLNPALSSIAKARRFLFDIDVKNKG